MNDVDQKLNTIGTFLESIHSFKQFDYENQLHTDIFNCYSKVKYN